MDTILVTGATGFLGSHIISSLVESGFDVRAYSRQIFKPGMTAITCPLKWKQGELDQQCRLNAACDGVDAVVHCAGIADSNTNDLETLLRFNSEGTKNVFLAAANSQVKKFLYMSSVHASSPTVSYYSRSKSEAELFLCSDEAAKYSIQRFILRLGNVYGPGMRGNLMTLLRLIQKRRLPPLPRLNSHLALVGVDDLCQAIMRMAEQASSQHSGPAVATGPDNVPVYPVTDGQTYQLKDIELGIRRALAQKEPGWALPVSVCYCGVLVAEILGRLLPWKNVPGLRTWRTMTRDQCVDDSKTRDQLSYNPRSNFYDALPLIIQHETRQ